MGRRAALAVAGALVAGVVVLTMFVFANAEDPDATDGRPSDQAVDDPTDDAVTTTDPVVPVFEGDPDSPFCAAIRDADDTPVLDPFEGGIEPREVELRLRALRVRFGEFAAVAPPALEADLDAVVDGLDDLDALLADNDYDFDRVAESGTDISLVSDPAFNAIGTRLLAYRDQVCRA